MSEAAEKTCEPCIYRIPGHIKGWRCASLKSAFYNKPIEKTGTCDRFKRDPNPRSKLTLFICQRERMGIT